MADDSKRENDIDNNTENAEILSVIAESFGVRPRKKRVKFIKEI